MKTPEQDLRVKKTITAIHNTFKDMIIEMDFEKITINELSKRAMISRKTFYLHYTDLDSLLNELQNSIISEFIQRIKKYCNIRDITEITREFFLYCENQNALNQRILCSGNYRFFYSSIIYNINSNEKYNKQTQNLIAVFLTSANMEIYRQWVKDNRNMPLKEVVKLTSNLISHGIYGLLNDVSEN